MKITRKELKRLIEAFVAGDNALDPDNVISAKDAYRGARRQSVKSIDKYRASVDKTPIGQSLMGDDPMQAFELGIAANPDMFTDHEKAAVSIPKIDRRTERPINKTTARARAAYLDGRSPNAYTMIVELEDGLVAEAPFEYAFGVDEITNPRQPSADKLQELMYYVQELKEAELKDDSVMKSYILPDIKSSYFKIKAGALKYINNNYNRQLTLNDNFVSIKVKPEFKRMEDALMMGEEMLRSYQR